MFYTGLLAFIGLPSLVSYFLGRELRNILSEFILATVIYTILFIWVMRGGLSGLNKRNSIKDRLYKQHCKNKIKSLRVDLEKSSSRDNSDRAPLKVIAIEIKRLLKDGNLTHEECNIDSIFISELIKEYTYQR